MGKIVRIGFDEIHPHEAGIWLPQFLDQTMISQKNLPPPSARLTDEGLVMLDGRHRSFMHFITGSSTLDVYLASTFDDFMSFEQFPDVKKAAIVDSNAAIKEFWNYAVDAARELGMVTLHEHYTEVLKKRPYMSSVSECLEWTKRERNTLYYSIFGED